MEYPEKAFRCLVEPLKWKKSAGFLCMGTPVSFCSNLGSLCSIRTWPYWTSRENSWELTELSSYEARLMSLILLLCSQQFVSIVQVFDVRLSCNYCKSTRLTIIRKNHCYPLVDCNRFNRLYIYRLYNWIVSSSLPLKNALSLKRLKRLWHTQ
jgi:hypothetical protein